MEAYVAYTHYVERLHQDATGKGAREEHAENGKGAKHDQHKKESDHSTH